MNREWLSELSACKGYVFEEKWMAEKAIHHLTTCATHRGQHHFAVFAEGKGVAMSDAGFVCARETAIERLVDERDLANIEGAARAQALRQTRGEV